jgi:hypothetical protein
VSELVLLSWWAGVCGGVGEAGDAELDGFGAAGADLVHLGEFGVGAGEADLEALGLAVPVVGFGFGDAGEQVVADLFQPCAGGRVRAQQRQRRQLCSWMQAVS